MKKLIFLAVLLLCGRCYSQMVTHNSIPITITTGTSVTVNGGITSSGNTTISNNGTINLTGDFINNSNNNLFGTSAGTVDLNGGNQNIGGTTSTAFNNLLLTGTGNKTLMVNTSVGGTYAFPSGILQLNDKILYLNSKLLSVENSSAAAISRTSGFIQSETNSVIGYGQIRWLTGNSPAGTSYVIPFGKDAGMVFLPLQMDITTAGLGSNGSFTIATYPTLSDNLPLPTSVTSLLNNLGSNNANMVLDRYWIIEPNDYQNLPVSNLTFTYRDIEHVQPTNSINESLLKMQFNNGSVWSPIPTGTVNTVANTILVNNVANYALAWTAVDQSSPLPIELIYFTAEPINEKEVICSWTTATEINNDYFSIQRSANGFDIEEIGIVDGAGNSTNMNNYSFHDFKPLNGLSYYRLKQTDFDGSYSFSNWVSVSLSSGYGYQIFPNPCIESVNISTTGDPIEKVMLQIVNQVGQEVYSGEWNQKQQSVFNIPTTPLASGIYSLVLQGDTWSNKLKLVVEK
jgi:hypothetical protein